MMLTVHPAAVNGDWGQACPAIGMAVARTLVQLFRPTGKEIAMRLLMVLLTLALFGTTLVGCKAGAEIDPDGHTTVAPAR